MSTCKICGKQDCTINCHRPLTAEQQMLVKNHIALAYKLLNKFTKNLMHNESHYDDLESAAMFALVRAAQGWNPDEGYTFGAYMGRAVRREIAEAYYKYMACGTCANPRKETQLIPVKPLILLDRDEYYDLEEHDKNEAIHWSDEQWAEVYEQIKKELGPMEAKIAYLKCHKKLTLKEIAKEVGITHWGVTKALQRLQRLQDNFVAA